jgi:selenoprotein W-related protein
MKATITIVYCPKCGWLLRASYMAQELLSSFTEDIHGVLLQPADTSGQYSIYVDEQLIFDRKKDNGFPDIKSLKQSVRDIVNPAKSLGHTDH